MGRETVRALCQSPGFDVVSAIDRQGSGGSIRDWAGADAPDIPVEDKLGAALDRSPADVLVDFSHASAAASHAISAMKRGVSPVIGCTGLSDVDLRELTYQATELGVPAMYVPNFAVGAVLLTRFAQMAAKWMPNAEIIEMHHEDKEDAPSGTALLTAELIASGRTQEPARLPRPQFKVEGVRGGKANGVTIHSVRMPGLLAHQLVIFGSPGETLTLRHDSLDRDSFMVGVKICVRNVRSQKGLVVGLDKIQFGP
jgi:4-hydroxy-tetrahydrodipicolinate reductase